MGISKKERKARREAGRKPEVPGAHGAKRRRKIKALKNTVASKAFKDNLPKSGSAGQNRPKIANRTIAGTQPMEVKGRGKIRDEPRYERMELVGMPHPYLWVRRHGTRAHPQNMEPLTPIMAKVEKGSQVFPVESLGHKEASLILLDRLADTLVPASLLRNDERQPQFRMEEMPSCATFRFPLRNLSLPQDEEHFFGAECMCFDKGKVMPCDPSASCFSHHEGEEYLYVTVGRDENGKILKERAHRIVCAAFWGPPKIAGMGNHVRHLCSNPLCLSPMHVRWGTAGDNAKDRDKKRRRR